MARGGPLRADAARNRERVLEAARERLAAGDDSLQLNAIAKLAGVGVGTVYRHFPTRHALLEALVTERFRSLVDRARAAAGDDDPARGLRSLLRFALDLVTADAGFAAVLESADRAEGAAAALKSELDGAVTRLLDRAREVGAIRSDLDADDVRRLVCGVQHAVGAGGDAGLYLDVLLGGLRPR
ncbi:TetR/AcrR family transcriptional regulator [Saccharothrix syringae]|uniref:TetR/AcrR family transcriptional regulator n=1 Tax=Saccharothrix syringae TaxID=103733 RepID=UPI00068CAD4C|nr:TetR family transcriptional regulator [Saccharothrix syringae]